MRTLLVAAAAALALSGTAVAQTPSTIRLPDGFQPEGIAAGAASQLYVGSLADGAIWRGSARTGEGGVLAPGKPGRVAAGIEVALGNIFIAGGSTGVVRVQDARTGADIVERRIFPAGQGFINDVAITPYAAWFTDSVHPVLYAMSLRNGGQIVRLPLTGDLRYQAGFNLNGIAQMGSMLVAVQSNTGKLFLIDPRNGQTKEIDLGGATLPNGDGLFQRQRTLYVVQNRDNRVAEVRLDPGYASGRVVRRVADADFQVPTTVAPAAGWIWAVNARFGTDPTATTRYDIVRTAIRDRRSARF
ncbi:MAG TPA: hypothetical protein VD931_16225 [Baekduia sp.]|nr:hypothetical protein [Baekduia sp.]